MVLKLHCSADAGNDYEGSGYDETPIEVSSELLQYDLDEEEADRKEPPVSREEAPAKPAPSRPVSAPAGKAGARKSPAKKKRAADVNLVPIVGNNICVDRQTR